MATREANELVLDLTEDVEFFWKQLMSTPEGRARALELLDKAPIVLDPWENETHGKRRIRFAAEHRVVFLCDQGQEGRTDEDLAAKGMLLR